jgi:hypothetical protein
MVKPVLCVAAFLFVFIAHWTATVLPMVGAGPVRMPGFAAVVLAVLLAVLWAVVRFMVLRPVRQARYAGRPGYVRGVWQS